MSRYDHYRRGWKKHPPLWKVSFDRGYVVVKIISPKPEYSIKMEGCHDTCWDISFWEDESCKKSFNKLSFEDQAKYIATTAADEWLVVSEEEFFDDEPNKKLPASIRKPLLSELANLITPVIVDEWREQYPSSPKFRANVKWEMQGTGF